MKQGVTLKIDAFETIRLDTIKMIETIKKRLEEITQ